MYVEQWSAILFGQPLLLLRTHYFSEGGALRCCWARQLAGGFRNGESSA